MMRRSPIHRDRARTTALLAIRNIATGLVVTSAITFQILSPASSLAWRFLLKPSRSATEV